MSEHRRCAWIDASAGAAGDMLLGALLDAGASLDAVQAATRAVAGHDAIEIDPVAVRRHGLRATRVDVRTSEQPAPRTVAEVLGRIASAPLSETARAFAADVFGRLGRAEAAVHGDDVATTHLHEVGALDAIADVVGCAAALESLGLLGSGAAVVVSPVAVGSGVAASRHGSIPVPAPAVLAILRDADAPVTGGSAEGELCTPTGAALLAAIATAWGSLPAMRIEAIGLGGGQANPPDRANVVRIVVGTAVGAATSAGEPSWRDDDLLEVEATVDDLDPRLWPDVLEALVRAGAVDAWLAPVVMRKGRPGHVVTALATAATVDAIARSMFSSSTTLGLRIRAVSRRALPRDERVVEVEGCEIRIKRAFLDGEIVTLQPEYRDAVDAAERLGRPVRWVLEQARAAADAAADRAGGSIE